MDRFRKSCPVTISTVAQHAQQDAGEGDRLHSFSSALTTGRRISSSPQTTRPMPAQRRAGICSWRNTHAPSGISTWTTLISANATPSGRYRPTHGPN